MVIIDHDRLLEFGGCFDVRRVLFVEPNDAVADLGAHVDGFYEIGDLLLKDGETIIDDGLFFELGTLLACGVLGEHGFGSFGNESAAEDGAERYSSDGAGEGLNRLIRVKFYSCHNDLIFIVLHKKLFDR